MEEKAKKARNFRNYKVWQDAVDYASKVYKVTSEMPWFEKKGLCDQLQRAVVSISSNIAEGAAKPSDIEFAHFLEYSDGEEFKPYLRSMSSMTAKEKTLMATICLKYVSGNVEGAVSELSDFYNSRYFDYRGLIPMGLALEAPDDMYKTK